jgi:putative nucleotidyltransferase with HDIG domain
MGIDKGLNKKFYKYLQSKNFEIFSIYNQSHIKIFFYKNTLNPEQITTNLIKHHNIAQEHFPKKENYLYEYFDIDKKNFYILVFYPIYHDKKLMGYINAIKKINSQDIVTFEKKITRMNLIIFFSLLVFALVIFPLIYIAYKELEQKRLDIIFRHLLTVRTLGNAIALRDSDTNEHNYRVVLYSIYLAEKLKLNKEDMKKLIIGAYLHDIGKIGIPDNILLKTGKLTNEEFEIMKTHVTKGLEIIKDNKYLQDAKDVILNHHEKYDGSGYPNRLKEDQIPFIARIFSIVDVFDALTSKRPYKKPLSYQESINIIKESKSKHFDPLIVDTFLKISKNLYDNIRLRELDELKDKLDYFVKKYFIS